MALVLADRVQETASAPGTGTVSLLGAVTGFQTFSAAIGNGNTTFYTIADQGGANWEVGIGTYSTSGNTLSRDTVLASSAGAPTKTNFNTGTQVVFVTYPSEKSVNLDASGNVSALGTIASGTWQGTTIGVAYGGTGVTASSGPNSVMLRDANQNVAINRLNQFNTAIVSAGGTTTLTAASSFSFTLTGTANQTFRLPDATTLTTGVDFQFNNNSTGLLTIVDTSSNIIGTITSGGAAEIFLLSSGTANGTWDVHGFIPENVTWGTNALALGSTVITGGTWNGGTIGTAYGGTGLTSFTSGGALYATSTSALTSGTLPPSAGGTGATGTPTNGQLLIGNGTNYTVASLTAGTGISTSVGVGSLTVTNSAPMVYPGAGIPNSTGSSWGTSYSTTGTGTVVALQTSPSFTTPNIGAATGTSLSVSGQLTSTVATGTPPLVVSSTTQVANLNAATAGTATNATNIAITDDTSTNATMYPTWVTSTSGNLPARVSSSKFTFNPSTGSLNASQQVATNGLLVNNMTVNASYSIPSGYSASSTGPITVASGVSVTVPSGSRWVVL